MCAGIESGQALQLDGEGGPAASKEGIPGNLIVQVAVAQDPVLNRRGANIHVSVELDFADAILGGEAKYVVVLQHAKLYALYSCCHVMRVSPALL